VPTVQARHGSGPNAADWIGTARPKVWRHFLRWLLIAVEASAAFLLVADLLVVGASVLGRHFLAAPLVWSDDVARALLLAVTFLGAAAALARGENAGVTFFVDRLSPRRREQVDAAVAIIIVFVAAALCWNTVLLLRDTAGQTVGSGLPQELFFAPLGIAAAAMTLFAVDRLIVFRWRDTLSAALLIGVIVAAWLAWSAWAPEQQPDMTVVMAVVFAAALIAGVPIAFVLALSTLVFVWAGDILPGEFFAQQMARGIDNFVLLAVPFFILVGYLMEANGMSVRLISLLQRGAGRLRGGLDVVMVLSMVIFSGISGSKMADIAAVGSVLVPAARKSGQKPGEAVALLAASAVMAETIPPCVNLIILGFVANLSIGGLFMAGLLPSALMAAALIVFSIILGRRTAANAIIGAGAGAETTSGMVVSGIAAFGLIALIFGGYRSGFATATEISAFAVAYAVVVGAVLFREMTWRNAFSVLRFAAVRSGMVLFIVAAAQSLAYVLTLQQIPHAIAELLVELSAAHGAWVFLLLSIVILIVMGSMLEGAAALIIFGPLLMPVARQLGVDPLHYGVILVVGMGIGLFAPPLGLGLYGACLIGGVKLEETVWPIMKYLGLLLLCLLLIAFGPQISTALPRAMGY
jgi:tripartite ATP-independent transporter DctM subunit